MILFWILGGGFLRLLLAKFIIGVIHIIFEILDGILSMLFDHDYKQTHHPCQTLDSIRHTGILYILTANRVSDVSS